MPQPEDFSGVNKGDTDKLNFVDIDLSVARSNVRFDVGGFSFMNIMPVAFDDATTVSTTKTTGLALARVDDTLGTPILLNPGFEYRFSGAKTLYVSNAAQPNKMLRVYTATGPNIRMNSQPTVTISALPAVSISGNPKMWLWEQPAITRGTSFGAAGGIVATPITVISVAANTTGAILHTLRLSPSSQAMACFADTAAPSDADDGSKCSIFKLSGATQQNFQPNMYLPPGIGCWIIGKAGGGGEAQWSLRQLAAPLV